MSNMNNAGDQGTTAEKALARLAFAAANYLEYLKEPRAFVTAPTPLLLEETVAALNRLATHNEDAAAQLPCLLRAYNLPEP